MKNLEKNWPSLLPPIFAALVIAFTVVIASDFSNAQKKSANTQLDYVKSLESKWIKRGITEAVDETTPEDAVTSATNLAAYKETLSKLALKDATQTDKILKRRIDAIKAEEELINSISDADRNVKAAKEKAASTAAKAKLLASKVPKNAEERKAKTPDTTVPYTEANLAALNAKIGAQLAKSAALEAKAIAREAHANRLKAKINADNAKAALEKALAASIDVKTYATQQAVANRDLAAQKHFIGNRERSAIAESRGATAHDTWFNAYALMAILGVVVIVGAGWIIYVSLDDIEAAPNRTSIAEYDLFYKKAKFTLKSAALILTVAIGFVIYLSSFFSIILHINAPTLEIIKPFLPEFTGTAPYMPDLTTSLSVGGLIVSLGIIAVILAAASTLLEHPTREHAEAEINTGRSKNPSRTMSDDQAIYIQYLVRCFERARVSIYLGSVLMGVATYHYKTILSWPLAFLPPAPALSLSTSTSLSSIVKTHIAELSTGYGLVFTVILLVVLVPVILILRKRAWRLVRAMNPDKTPADHAATLTSYKLTLSFASQIGQISALITPAGIGALLAVLQTSAPG